MLEYPLGTALSSGRGAGAAASPAQQAYSLQYISFVLIVLTFVIGAFARGPMLREAGSPSTPPAMPTNPLKRIAQLEYRDLFGHADSTLNAEKTEALARLLASHDVDLEAVVYTSVEDEGLSDTRGVRLAFARSRALMEFLAKGVPAEAVRIFVQEGAGESQASLSLYRSVKDE